VRNAPSIARAALVLAVATLAKLTTSPAHAFVPPNKKLEMARGDMALIPATAYRLLREAKWSGPIPGSSPGGGDPLGYAVSVASFYLDRTEVTAGAYAACVQAGACGPLDAGDSFSTNHSSICTYNKAGHERHPINCVSYVEASKFCAWAGKRLPTEAEWELAARGTSGRAFPWGDAYPEPRHMNAADASLVRDAQTKLAPPETYTNMWADTNGDDGFGFTAPVGSYPEGASPFGIFDMSGNVEEWTAEPWWDLMSGGGPPAKGASPPASGEFVIRGGAWDLNGPENFSATHRSPQNAGTRAAWLGFRCARDA
jgi:formylglycine-generating enzyme required for sulfatase activity